jgi:hypothetical protein
VENNINYSTKQLVEELSKRPGVKKITAEPYVESMTMVRQLFLWLLTKGVL